MRRAVAILLVAVAIPFTGFARGRSEEGEPSMRLPESVAGVASAEWQAEFAQAVSQKPQRDLVPAVVLAMAVSRLPDEIVQLPVEEAVAIVRREAALLDASIRRGSASNRAAIESARRMERTVGEAVRARAHGPPDSVPEGERGRTRDAGPPSTTGPPGGIPGNRASEHIQERGSPAEPPGGPPDHFGRPDGPPGQDDRPPAGGPNSGGNLPGLNDEEPGGGS